MNRAMALPANIDPAAHLLAREVLLEPPIAVQRAGNQMVKAGGWFLLAQFTEHRKYNHERSEESSEAKPQRNRTVSLLATD